jgi:hypothetical protein
MKINRMFRWVAPHLCSMVFPFLLPGAVAQTTVTNLNQSTPQYLHPAEIGSEYNRMYRALGTRLPTPGAERLVITGAFSYPSKWSGVANVQIATDISGQLAISGNYAGSAFSIVFDGQSLSVGGGSPGPTDQTLVDTLTNDTVEHFLFGQKSGNATRQLAAQARIDSTTVPPGTPAFCDVYQVLDRSTATWWSAGQFKVYCFDSATHLLRSVSYQSTAASGVKTQVQTYFSNWQSAGGTANSMPWSIQRYENGSLALSLTVQAASLTATANDGLFTVKN